jgi:hypothetical protein
VSASFEKFDFDYDNDDDDDDDDDDDNNNNNNNIDKYFFQVVVPEIVQFIACTFTEIVTYNCVSSL